MRKKLSKIVIMLIIITLLFGIISSVNIVKATDENPNIEAWDGTTEEPTSTRVIENETYYEIENAKQLAYLAQIGGEWLKKNYILTNDIVLNDVNIEYYKYNGELITDSNLLRKWIPIASGNGEYFEGIFDGNNYSISGLYIENKENKSIRII